MGFMATRFVQMGFSKVRLKSSLGLAVVDITNPAAREWYATKLKALLDLGVDTFKVNIHHCENHPDFASPD